MSHISSEQRYQIEVLIDSGFSNKKIAEKLGKHKSSIGREIRRCGKKREAYDPVKAHRDYLSNKANRIAYKFNSSFVQEVIPYLNKQWSPEQISNRFKKESRSVSISHEGLYQFIYKDATEGGELYKELRHSRKKRKPKGNRLKNKEIIPNRTSIELRPKIVEEKGRFGDWEADTVIGTQVSGGGVLVTLVERKSKYTLMRKVENKTSDAVIPAIIEMIADSSIGFETITFDNGTEFAGHLKITDEYGIETYFAHPYHSWERGLNENTNGLIRQYLPKGKPFNEKTEKEIKEIEIKLNRRPRKTLEFSTPTEFYNENFKMGKVAFES